jgi:hypothetical protein
MPMLDEDIEDRLDVLDVVDACAVISEVAESHCALRRIGGQSRLRCARQNVCTIGRTITTLTAVF